MNNQAFRKLVYQHNNNKFAGNDTTTNQKSSKEIARDAVEQELNEKKRKLNGGTFDGDFDQSDDENDYSSTQNGNEDKDDRKKKEAQKYRKRGRKNKNDDDDEEGENGNKSKKDLSKYRDRAKERREGNNMDYQAAKKISLHIDSNNGDTSQKHDMTKFLGGDEQFTHLVRGLDRTLADKVRREEMVKENKIDESQGNTHIDNEEDDENIDLDQIMEEAKALKVKNIKSKQKPNPIEAKSSSSLASTMARYLQKIKARQTSLNEPMSIVNAHIMNPSLNTELNTAAKNLHCSTLNFSLLANHQNLQQYGWEIPYISMAAVRHNADIATEPCTPVDIHLITKIKSVLAAINTKKKKHSDEAKEREKKRKKLKLKETAKMNIKEHDDDSDDDIYGDIGDYVPPSIRARKSS